MSSRNERPKQVDRILDRALAEKDPVTDAMLDLGILRLASRISELKKAGVPIRRDWAKVTNRHGETCNVLRYSLDGSLDTPGGEE